MQIEASRPRLLEPCELCDDWPGPTFQMDRPCCVARWLKRQPPHVDRHVELARLRQEKGAAFVADVQALWEKVE
jgi:hypothetical protein